MTEKYHHSALPIGAMLRDYRIETVLGHGGFGITYKARHKTLENQVVAIKEYLPNDLSVRDEGGTVNPKSSGSDEDNYAWGLDRFVQEAKTLANFDHRSIVRILTFFEDNNTAYLVMQYEEGGNLKALYGDKRGQIAEQTLLDTLVYPLLDGLKIVHARNVLHRDIKPENIYIREDNTPVLLDFGSARQSVSGKSKSLSAIVTSGFAPWEQYSTKGNQGPWTDIYSFGAVLYWLIGGKPPDASDRINAKTYEDPDPLKLASMIGEGKYSRSFLESIDHALKLLDRDRPQTIEEWLPEFTRPVRQEEASEAKTRALQRSGQRKRKAEKPAEDASEAKTRALQRSRRGKRQEQEATIEELKPTVEKRSAWIWVGIALLILVIVGYVGWDYDSGVITERETGEIAKTRELERKRAEVRGLLESAEKAIGDKSFGYAENLIDRAQGFGIANDAVANVKEKLVRAKVEEQRATADKKKGQQVEKLLAKAEKAKSEEEFSIALLYLDEADLVGVKRTEIEAVRSSVLSAKQKAKDDEEAKRRKAARARAEVQEQAEREEAQARERESNSAEKVGSTWTDPVTGMEFMWVPKGCFQMGSPASEADRGSDEEQHRVCLSKGYWLGKYEVTQGQWQKVMGSNPSNFENCGTNCPVEQVSWNDAQDFIKKLNKRNSGSTFKLPTEAQWEYAARAGTTTAFSFGNTITTDQVNYDGNYPYGNGRKGEYRETTVRVGSLPANSWGLHEMHGNVWEWVEDRHGDYSSGSVTDPTGAASGSRRVDRGGSWSHRAHYCRSAVRDYNSPDNRYLTLGFRVLRAH